ncbi:glutathione binding-like protein [Psychrobacter lutiphocae]|uniref:glutathione binding-like protein n=1 Tax=Psychrobacter lutiphocae TaxID=540500 RepID=UPI00035C67F8|nr:glutathione binding-like protein [Psychrobacter lutiphocae]
MLAFQHTHPSKAQRIDQVPEIGPKSIERVIKVLPYFDNILQKNTYLMGEQLTYADIVLYIGLDFGRVLKFDPTTHGSGIARFYKMMDERFGFKKN